ncbi:MAG: preprotein translocase subunit SecE [Bacteroidaceae bacterium]|jgi:preprotein translocase subunit SecE|nr:preprotein translocase subunit SecE [Bacteroidaceae bacterium]MBO7067214.1 preprotein translocase subunit SecE [Bacteroidaceae bacterium]
MLEGIKTYCKDSYEELVHKTTWPTRSELMNSAVVVLTASLCIALVVFVMDWFFQSGMEFVYGLLR